MHITPQADLGQRLCDLKVIRKRSACVVLKNVPYSYNLPGTSCLPSTPPSPKLIIIILLHAFSLTYKNQPKYSFNVFFTLRCCLEDQFLLPPFSKPIPIPTFASRRPAIPPGLSDRPGRLQGTKPVSHRGHSMARAGGAL